MQIHVSLSLIQRKRVLLPPLGWEKQFLVQIHMEPVLKGDLFLMPKSLGSLVSLQLWPRLSPAALCPLAARASSGVWGSEQAGKVRKRH